MNVMLQNKLCGDWRVIITGPFKSMTYLICGLFSRKFVGHFMEQILVVVILKVC